MQVIFIIFNCQTPELDKSANVCLVHLYTLEGAIHDTEYNRLSENTKKELKEFSDFLKK